MINSKLDIDEFCKNIVNIKGLNIIDEELDKLTKEDLFNLAKELLKKRPESKRLLMSVLCRLFEDTQEFAELLNTFFEKIYSEKPFPENIVRQYDRIIFSLVKRTMYVGKRPGYTAGNLLSSIVRDMKDAKDLMFKGLNSEDAAFQRCSLMAINSILSCNEMNDKIEYFNVLRKIAPKILQDNTDLLIFGLHHAFENDNSFEKVLESEINRRGIIGVKGYILVACNRQKISIRFLEKMTQKLESLDPASEIITMGLGKIYEYDPNFIVERIRRIIKDYKKVISIDDGLICKIDEIGSGPILRMLEAEIDSGDEYIDEYTLEVFFPHFDKKIYWVSWCEKWKDDPLKEKIILKSLGIILSRFISSYSKCEIRDRSITLVKNFAKKKNIDYDNEIKNINFGKDFHEGKENKENTIRALYILKIILSPHRTIDIDILSENLEKAPYLSNAIDKDWLIQIAKLERYHPFAFIFNTKSIEENELTRLREEIDKENDKNKKIMLELEYGTLFDSLKCQSYWENVFKILENNHIPSPEKERLQDIDSPNNIWGALAEAEVLSRFAQYFNVIKDPNIPELGLKKLDAMIKYKEEKALIEIRVIQEKYEESLTYGATISIPGGKIKSTLRNKFEGQLKNGKDNPKIPILIILCLEGFIGNMEDDLKNAIYGTLQVSLVDEGTTRANNGFYNIQGTEIVTTIGAYRRNYYKEDPLEGRLYFPNKSPTNKLSQEFKLKISEALFGKSSRYAI